ncbi:transglutaminase family protein [bacterium]|nr:transglutaminase family protein [bacterium]
MTKYTKVSALINLLGDEDAKISKIAQQELILMGKQVVPELEFYLFNSKNTREQKKIISLIFDLKYTELDEKFAFLCLEKDDNFLEESFLLIAKLEFPEIDTNFYKNYLEESANKIRPKIIGVTDPFAIIEELNLYFFEEEGYKGNSKNYYEPENSFLNCVIDRKIGIQISLCTLYIFIAKRLDLNLKGVGMPGHFLLKYEENSNEFFLDIFNGGTRLQERDCINYLVKTNFGYKREYLEAISDRQILVRMFRNLIGIYQKNQNYEKLRLYQKFSGILENS